MDDDNAIVPGVYATGWIKRGPVGLIGHTKSDAMETIQHLVKDQASWWSPSDPDEQSVTTLLDSRGVAYTNLAGWHRLDEAELARGAKEGRERIKVVPREEMLEISLGSALAPTELLRSGCQPLNEASMPRSRTPCGECELCTVCSVVGIEVIEFTHDLGLAIKTETSKFRLKLRISMLEEPITLMASSTMTNFECRIVGAR